MIERDRMASKALALAIVMVLLAAGAIGTECVFDVSADLAKGASLPWALFRFFRFFTNLTNIGTAVLMAVTALAYRRQRPLPSAPYYAAALVYMLVTGLTYEVLLRTAFPPRGFHVVTDAITHDVLPSLMLLYWIVFAPKTGLTFRDALYWLAYPLTYFTVIVALGLAGAGYPYQFLDAGRLGALGLARQFLQFTILFAGFGLLAVAAAGVLTRTRPASLKTAD